MKKFNIVPGNKHLFPADNPGCNHMLNHLSIIDSKGWVTTCCQYDHQNQMPNVKDVTTLDNILNSKVIKRRRKEMAAGERISNCQMCWHQEDIGMPSHKYHSWQLNQYWKVKRGVLQNLELGLDYTCNMMCRMCKASQSSKWGSAKQVNKLMKTVDGEHHNGQYTYSHYQKQVKTVLENTDLSELRKLQLVGGEPFYSKNFDWLMQKISNEANLSDLFMNVATNGSIVPKNSLDILKRIGRLRIGFSLDAIGDLASCIRWGVDFAEVDKNVKKWIKLSKDFPNIILSVHCTTSIMNMNKLDDITNYCEDNGLSISTNVLQGPKHLVPYQIPTFERKKFSINNKYKKENISEVASTMQKIVYADLVADNHLEGFIRSCKILDSYQGIRFKDVNPEIYELAEKYK